MDVAEKDTMDASHPSMEQTHEDNNERNQDSKSRKFLCRKHSKSSMDIQSTSQENIVLLSVTTEEGKDLGIDIYDADKSTKDESDDGALNLEIEVENARRRKEELANLLEEHSSIVRKIEDLSVIEQKIDMT